MHRQNVISRYHPDQGEAINTINELGKICPKGLVRYYKLPGAMKEAIYNQYYKPQKLDYKLDYIIVGPREGRISNIPLELVYSNPEYSIYHLISLF